MPAATRVAVARGAATVREATAVGAAVIEATSAVAPMETAAALGSWRVWPGQASRLSSNPRWRSHVLRFSSDTEALKSVSGSRFKSFSGSMPAAGTLRCVAAKVDGAPWLSLR